MNISEEIQNAFALATIGNPGATLIGTGGGVDYCMIRGEGEIDYILVWSDGQGDYDASSPDKLTEHAAIVAQVNCQAENDDDGNVWRYWGSDYGGVIMEGTARECIDWMSRIKGIPQKSRAWSGSF